jgi:fatty acid desaturase
MTTTSTPNVTDLARESAISLGHLVGQHVKVARLELAAEVRVMGRRATVVAVLAALVAIGYALAIAGLAVAIGGRAELGIPLVVVGLAHVVGAGAGLVFGPLRARAPRLRPMRNTAAAIDRALEKVHAR